MLYFGDSEESLILFKEPNSVIPLLLEKWPGVSLSGFVLFLVEYYYSSCLSFFCFHFLTNFDISLFTRVIFFIFDRTAYLCYSYLSTRAFLSFSSKFSKSIKAFFFFFLGCLSLFSALSSCSFVNFDLITARVKLRRKKAPIKIKGIKNKNDNMVKVSAICYIISVHPSKVTDWKIATSA